MKKAVLQLETLTCPSCIKKIQGTFDKMEGVEKAKVLFNVSKAKVEFDEGKVNPETLRETIEKLGYEVKAVKTA